MKKIGTIIALNSKKLRGPVYLTKDNILTTDIKMAKTHNADKAALAVIRENAITRFPEFGFTAQYIARWSDNVRI